MIFHDTDVQHTTIKHFYDKLLKLKQMMHTSYGKYIAEKRHKFTKMYLDQFLEEWQI